MKFQISNPQSAIRNPQSERADEGVRAPSVPAFRIPHSAFFLLAALFLFPLAACSGRRAAGKSNLARTPAAETLRISQGSDIISLDPYYKLESPSFSVQRNIFEPLTDTDAQNKLVPCLAESWRSVDATHWEFKLRRGVTFHDGEPFTAEDAIYSLRRAHDWPQSRVRSEIPTVKRVSASDSQTLVIETNIPDAILPLRLAAILILSRSAEATTRAHGEDWLATHANGTGPYRVKLWRKDETCLLEASPNYWGAKPRVKYLQFNPASNDATRMAALQRGDYDVMVNVPPRYVKMAEKLSNYHIVRNPSLRLIYLGLDCGRDTSPGVPGSPPNPLKDLRVRQAIAMSVANRLIVEKIMGGNAVPADQLLPEGVTGYDPAIKLERPNWEKAKKLLAEAGYPNGFTVRLDGTNDRYVNDSAILQAVAALLARAGIQVQVNALPKSIFFSQEERAGCSFFMMGWANTNGDGASTFDNLLHTPDPAAGYGGSNNSTAYSNPELDRLDAAASKEFDPQKRNELLKAANRVAMHDLVQIPLHFQMDLYAVSDRVNWTPRMETQVRGVSVDWK